MSTQQDIYAAGSESRPPMLNKENYVPWLSRLLRYAKSRPNGKLIQNSILNGPYVRKMIPELGDANREITVTETFHLQTDEELSDKELKQIKADDQAIQTILLGLPKDTYAAVDSCETAQEIWLRVQQMMKGSDIGIQEKNDKLFNEWEMFTSNEGESITKDLHTADYTQLYDFLKYNQKEVDELKAKRIAKNQDPLAFMANSNNPYYAGQNAGQNAGNPTGYNDVTGTQIDNALIYDTDGSAEVHENCDDNEIFNMFTQEEQYTELLEPIPESHQVPQNDNNVISEDTSVEQGGEAVEQHPANFVETRALYESLYQNLAIEVKKVNSVNRKLKETNANMTTKLGRYKNQEKCFEISQEKYDKLERCYQQSVYQEQCLSKKINALHLCTDKQIMTLNEQNSELNKQLSKEKSTVSFLLEEKKRENAHLKATYKNMLTLFLCHDTSKNTKFAKQPIVENLPKVGKTNALSNPVTLNSVSTPQESKSVNNDKVITPGMFRINPSKTSREEKHVPNTVSTSARTKPIIVSQPHVIIKKDVNSDLNGLSSTGVDNTKTRRLQPRSNTKHDRVLSASKSSRSKKKEAKVEEHHRNLLLSKNNKHISSTCNNLQIDSQDVISKVVCAMCKKCLVSVNHDKCLCNYENGKISRGKKQKAKVSFKENQMKYQPKIAKPKKVESHKSLDTPKPRNSRLLLRWSPTGKLFDKEGKIVDSSKSVSQSDCVNGNLKLLINFVWKFMGTVRFENDHVAAILGFGQFCDLDLEIAFRRNACFVRNLEGVDLLKGDRSTNLYTINLYEMASASPICLMARASSTKSWLWHQRLSHLNFDTINDLARNDLVASLPKFKYHKEHLCPSREQGKSNRASHPPKPVPNSRQRLHLLHMDLCGPMRIASINGKRVYNRWTKKIIETMNVSFDELSAMVFEQRSSKPGLQSMTFRHISSGLDLIYALSTITTQQPSEGELDLLFEAMYDDYIGGQPSATGRTVLPAQEPQARQTSTASTTTADTTPIPTNSSSLATNIPITSQDVDELTPNAMVDGNTFVNPMTLETHNWSSSAHQELNKIVKDEIFPIVNQVNARMQNFEIQFLKESAKFFRDFKSLAKEANEYLAKHKALELEIERLLRAVVSQDIMSVVQNNSIGETSNLQTKLERTKERFENCIIKKENEYAKLYNDWYKKCEECKFDKISYDKAYKDMQQKIKRLQAQLGYLKGKSKDTSCVSDTLNPLSQKLENENVELEFQVFVQKDNTRGTSTNTTFSKQSILGKPPKLGETHALSKPVTSNSIPTPQESKVMKNDKDSSFELNGFSDADYAGCKDTFKSTFGGAQFLGEKLRELFGISGKTQRVSNDFSRHVD
nr:hypothetical protein [Tanacetum cinerariifolium]